MTPRRVLATMTARFDSPCACGRLILAGEDVAGPVASGAWLHLECARRAYRVAGVAVEVRPVSSRRPAPSTRTRWTHRAVNGPRLYCPSCGRRIILGRDGTPVALSDGRYRHAACPDPRVTRTT